MTIESKVLHSSVIVHVINFKKFMQKDMILKLLVEY